MPFNAQISECMYIHMGTETLGNPNKQVGFVGFVKKIVKKTVKAV